MATLARVRPVQFLRRAFPNPLQLLQVLDTNLDDVDGAEVQVLCGRNIIYVLKNTSCWC